MQDFEKLLSVVRRKSEFDKNNRWYKGAESYLTGIGKELTEVIEEIPHNRQCYLEDELGDVLWNFLNAVLSLEKESNINLESVITRALNKYDERLSAIEKGITWSEVKLKQKKQLALEQASYNQKID